MATTQANLNSQTSILNPSYGPSQITDLLINNMIITKFGEVLQGNFKISPTNIGKLLLLMSVGEIKTYMTQLFNLIIGQIKKSPVLILYLVNYLQSFRKIKLKYKTEKNNTNQIIESLNNSITQNVNIEVDINFLSSFYNFLQNYKNCSYDEKLDSIVIKNIKEKLFVSKISNINIMLDGKIININNIIEYTIDINDKQPRKVGLYQTHNEKNINIKSILDLLSDDQKIVVKEMYNIIIEKFQTHETFIKYMDKYNGTPNSACLTIKNIATLLKQKYNEIDENITTIEITILINILHYNSIVPITNIFSLLKDKKKLLFEPIEKYEIDENYTQLWMWVVRDINIMVIEKYKSVFGNFVEIYNNLKNKHKSKLTFNLKIQSNDIFNVKHFMECFVSKVYEYNRITTGKIKIFNLTLEKEIILNEQPNPEYENYIEKKQILDKMKPEKDNMHEYMVMVNNFVSSPIPPKNIVKESFKYKTVVKQLNEIEKDLDTLYLRQKDKQKLISALYQFRDKKDILHSLGLPNKLNVIMYGEPGTGKSTSIHSIATYLQKDIYYINLKSITTNEEILTLFEYVNKNANSSIIVCEDIDAMTDVVLKRTNKVAELKVNDIIEKEKSPLSLEFLLNILQGTLTLDDSIFIVTTNYIDHLDPAFYRDGRFDVKIELKLCDRYQINCIFKKMIGRDIDSNVLQLIKEDTYSPATIIFHIKNYIFNIDMDDKEILAPFI